MDHATEKKTRLDFTVIKVEVMSKRKVPLCPQIIVNGKMIILKASVIRMEEVTQEILALGALSRSEKILEDGSVRSWEVQSRKKKEA